MSLINWGSESPEQLQIRRRLEEQALYEQAVRMAQAKNRAGNTTGAAGSGGDPLTGLYGVGLNGLIYSLDRSEANWQYDYLPFPDFTQLALNTDDGFLYATVDFSGTVYFIRIDRKTRELTFIDNNISDFVTKGASSLYYEGNGSFIYLDNFYKSSVSSIIRITLDEFSPESATAVQVSEVDSGSTGFLLRNLFLYDGAVWAIALSESNFITGPFDIESGTFVYSNLILPSPTSTNVVGLTSALGAVQHNGTVYTLMIWYDGDNYYIGLFKMDTVTGGAIAPYYVTLVKDVSSVGAENTAIFSLTRF